MLHRVLAGTSAVASVYVISRKRKVFAASAATTPFSNLQKWNYAWDRSDPQECLSQSSYADYYDSLYPSELIRPGSRSTRTLILVRHGQYHLDGKTDAERSLTELGRKQAQILGRRIRELGYQFDLIVNSGLQRAKETANIVVTELDGQNSLAPRVEEPSLNEGAPFPVEPPVVSYSLRRLLKDSDRIEKAFRKFFFRPSHAEKTTTAELIVCHANVIRYFVCRALQFPPEGWLRLSLANCSITQIVLHSDGRVVLRQLGDHGHMPKDCISFT